MASYLKKKFFKDPKTSQKQEHSYKCCVTDYDATYWLVNKILSFLRLKLNLQETQQTSSRILDNVIFWFIIINIFMAAALESVSMIMTASGGTLIELFTMMPCVGYLLVAISKAYKIKRYRPIYQNLVNELRDMWPVGEVTEEEQDILLEGLKNLRYVIKAYFTCTMVLGFIFVLEPYISLIKTFAGFKNQKRWLPFFYWFPFDPLQDNVYEIILAVQTFHCFCTIACMVSGDILCCLFLSHITTQFTLLQIRINKMFHVTTDKQLLVSYPLGAYNKEHLLKNNDQGMTKTEMEENIEEKLIKIIHCHRDLIRLSEDVENMYSFSFIVNFINSSIIICFSLFCVTFVEKWNEFNYKVFFITGIFQIWILYWYGQKLLDTSSGIGDALYNSGWYTSSNKIKKLILIMIHRSQRPVYITTYGFSIVSLESYAMILRTSWSYFTLMINVYKR